MTYAITVLDNGTSVINVDFSDEDIELNGETTVKGGQEEAKKYVATFERDLRANYAHLFPQPEPENFEGVPEDEIY